VAKVGTSNSDRTISVRLQCAVKKHNILRKLPDIIFIGGWVGPRARLDECENIRSPDRPTSSEFLYPLRYCGPQEDTISELKMSVVGHNRICYLL
jgi:hypothetical protein